MGFRPEKVSLLAAKFHLTLSQSLEELPTRQSVTELPDIHWKSYTDSIERVVKQHSSVYHRTRRRGGGGQGQTREHSTLLTNRMVSYSIQPVTFLYCPLLCGHM